MINVEKDLTFEIRRKKGLEKRTPTLILNHSY